MKMNARAFYANFSVILLEPHGIVQSFNGGWEKIELTEH